MSPDTRARPTGRMTNARHDRSIAEARQTVREARDIGQELSPAKSFIEMVVQNEDAAEPQDRFTEKELQDEAWSFLMWAVHVQATI